MATMSKELYEALIEAGVSKEKAGSAASVLGEYVKKDDDAVAKQKDLMVAQSDLMIVKTELKMGKWIVSGVGFGILLLIAESFIF